MKQKRIWITILMIAIPLVAGMITALLTRQGMEMFHTVPKSALTPPHIVFPIAWTILYVLMGIGAGMAAAEEKEGRTRALALFFIQLAVNIAWSFFYFNVQAYLFCFLWLILLWVLAFAMTRAFYQLRPLAGYLQIPYLIWLAFAGYLNLITWLLNR